MSTTIEVGQVWATLTEESKHMLVILELDVPKERQPADWTVLSVMVLELMSFADEKRGTMAIRYASPKTIAKYYQLK